MLTIAGYTIFLLPIVQFAWCLTVSWVFKFTHYSVLLFPFCCRLPHSPVICCCCISFFLLLLVFNFLTADSVFVCHRQFLHSFFARRTLLAAVATQWRCCACFPLATTVAAEASCVFLLALIAKFTSCCILFFLFLLISRFVARCTCVFSFLLLATFTSFLSLLIVDFARQ